MNNELLTAFQNILDFYFGKVDAETILDIAGCNEAKFGLHELMHVAKETNLFAQTATVKLEEVDKFLLPLVVYNEAKQAVVVHSISHGKAKVFQEGEVKELPLKALKKHTQAILFFRSEQKKQVHSRKKTYNWFFTPIKSAWKSYVEVGVISLFINFFALALPLFTMSIYDRVIPNFATETLTVLVGGIVLIFIFEMLFKTVRVYILERTGKKIGGYLEEALLERMLGVQTQYDHLLSGSKAMLFKELQQVKEFFSAKSMVSILDLPFFIIAVAVIYYISPAIAMVPLVVGFVLIGFNLIMQIPLANLAHEQFKDAQTKHGFLVETIQGRDAVKLVNASNQRLFVWRRMTAFYESLGERIQFFHHLATNSSYMLIQMVTLLVVSIGVYEIHDKNLSVGGLIAVTILSSRAMVPIVTISGLLLHLKKTREALASINEYWYLPREVTENTHLGLGELQGKIEFRDVKYFYERSKYPSLDGVSLTINPGEKVGIIGQTGAGKSTLLRLISALDTPTNGSVFLDGSDTTTLHPTEVREHIGIMPQDPFMFATTIKENIALSRSMDKESVNNVIELTGLDELIKKSGYGDALQVGENGDNLSVGQKHLVALARALVNDPKVLVLDEPTTGLDVGLEQAVVQRLKPIVEDKTLIVITHRFAALDLVDRVIVIEGGKVVADGKKEAVLNALQGKKS